MGYVAPIQPNESQLQKAILIWLEMLAMQKRLHYLRINSGAMVKTDGERQRMIRMAPAGTSDLILFFRQGKTVFVELKKFDGKLTKQQREFGQKMQALNYDYHVIRSVEEMRALVQRYLT